MLRTAIINISQQNGMNVIQNPILSSDWLPKSFTFFTEWIWLMWIAVMLQAAIVNVSETILLSETYHMKNGMNLPYQIICRTSHFQSVNRSDFPRLNRFRTSAGWNQDFIGAECFRFVHKERRPVKRCTVTEDWRDALLQLSYTDNWAAAVECCPWVFTIGPRFTHVIHPKAILRTRLLGTLTSETTLHHKRPKPVYVPHSWLKNPYKGRYTTCYTLNLNAKQLKSITVITI